MTCDLRVVGWRDIRSGIVDIHARSVHLRWPGIPHPLKLTMPKRCRSPERDARNRVLADPQSVRALDAAIQARAEAALKAVDARRAMLMADGQLRAASRWLGACDRKVMREAKAARARAVRTKATARNP